MEHKSEVGMADVTQGLSNLGDMAEKLQSGTAGTGAQSLDIGSLLGSMSMTTIIVGLVAGLIGTGYFMYGKKNHNLIMLWSGMALCVVPYFIGNTALLIVACLAMAAAPFVV
jgi:hypothetical protein